MVRCIPITFTQARTGLQGMRVNSSALKKRELGKTLGYGLDTSELPVRPVLVLSVFAASMLSDPPPSGPVFAAFEDLSPH